MEIFKIRKTLEASVEKNVEALICYDTAIKLNPKYLKAWNNKARILVRLGKAIEESRRVLPQMGSTYKGKPTKWRYPDDMFQQAQDCCDKVLILGQTSWESEDTASLNPTKTEERGIDLDILDNHGWDSSDRMAQRTLLMMGNISHHMSRLQSIYYSSGGFTIDEDDPEYDKLVTERINNYLEEAVTWYKGATMVNPEYIEAWHYMGLAYYDLDKGDEVIECFAKVINLDPKNVTMLEELGDTFAQMEETSGTPREYISDPMPTSSNPTGIKKSIYCFK